METVNTILIFLLGVAVGSGFWSVISFLILDRKSGTLHIEETDLLGEPCLFLELSEKVGTLRKKKKVIFEVSDKSFLSQQ